MPQHSAGLGEETKKDRVNLPDAVGHWLQIVNGKMPGTRPI